ncbi:MAG: Benzoyl-CoA reductase subunit B [Ignavibacteria bacterium]|nr:Benzoyl-CoA reductase subunit B [Ignavibacteria bacterium]
MYELKTTLTLRNVMKDYFLGFAKAEKIAWCTSVGPAELLRSFGFEVYFPENHGALTGTTRKSNDYIPAAMNIGYSDDICSYLTGDIGAYLTNRTPLRDHYGIDGIPKPDLIVYNTNQCREVQDWFNFFANEFKCPAIGIFPPRHIDEITEEEINDVREQFKAMIPECEKASGNKFDIDNFRNTLRLSKEATELWKEVLASAKNSPAPLSFFDGTIHMGPIVVMRGTQAAIDYYRKLLNEISENVSNKIGIVSKENSRIYWDGMPIWGKLRTLSDLFIQNNSVVAASTYCNSWVFDSFDESDPFTSSAKAYTEIFINRSENAKMKIIKQTCDDFRIDGVIFHDAKTCFNNSNARFGMPQRFYKKYGIPVLIIEGDLCDLRFFSEGQSITKIETFIEQLETQKILN